MNQQIRLYHADMLSYTAVGTLQLITSAGVCTGVNFDGLMNRWHRVIEDHV